MGASKVEDLIAKGKAQNNYNNSGIKSDPTWLGFFNDALRDLVDDLDITASAPIVYDGAVSTMDLPADYYNLVEVYTNTGHPVKKRRFLKDRSSGYWIEYKGSKWTIDVQGYSAQTFDVVYNRYAAVLTEVTDTPEIPSAGEMALPYYAVAKGLRNNNQVGQAQEMESQYKEERKKLRTALARGRG